MRKDHNGSQVGTSESPVVVSLAWLNSPEIGTARADAISLDEIERVIF